MRRLFEAWRRKVVEPRIFGRVLDVGKGLNSVTGSVSIDNDVNVRPSVVARAESNPFLPETFDCCVLMASINYVSSPGEAILGCHRVLTKYGRLVITCTTPIGGMVHRLFRWRQPRGLSVKAIRTLVEANGFRLVYDKPFMLWSNHLYVFGKEVAPTENLVQIQKVIKEKIHSH